MCGREFDINHCAREKIKLFYIYRLLAVSLNCANLVNAEQDETLRACLLDLSLECYGYAKAINTSTQKNIFPLDNGRGVSDDHHLLLSWLKDRLSGDANAKLQVESKGFAGSVFELAAKRIRSLSHDAMHSYFFSMQQVRVFLASESAELQYLT